MRTDMLSVRLRMFEVGNVDRLGRSPFTSHRLTVNLKLQVQSSRSGSEPNRPGELQRDPFLLMDSNYKNEFLPLHVDDEVPNRLARNR